MEYFDLDARKRKKKAKIQGLIQNWKENQVKIIGHHIWLQPTKSKYTLHHI